MSANRPRRGARFARRAHEQREIRQGVDTIVDVDDARRRVVEHLAAARMAALEGRLVVLAGQITSLEREAGRQP